MYLYTVYICSQNFSFLYEINRRRFVVLYIKPILCTTEILQRKIGVNVSDYSAHS
jgi:hypothetical protein